MSAQLRESLDLTGIDNDASETLDAATYEAMFSTLADLADSGLLTRLSFGGSLSDAPALHLDTYARLARLADDLSVVRAKAVRVAANDQRAWLERLP
jgi:hypothetical protein